MATLSHADAEMYWRSAHAATDQFLLYAFDESDDRTDPSAQLRARAARIADLHLGIEPLPGDLDFPRWTRVPITATQWRRHEVENWTDCLAAVADLMAPGCRDPELLWRVHLFGPLTGVPEAADRAMVVVLQISHALGDGRRASDIARRLLSDGAPDTAPRSPRLPGLVAAGLGAMTAAPRLALATAVGLAAWRDDEPEAGPPAVAPTALNLPADGPIALRTVTVGRERLRRFAPSVTVAVLAGIADLLPQIGGATDDGRVFAELTVARTPIAEQRNNFHTVGIDLHAADAVPQRAASIAAQIDDARQRDTARARRRARRAAALAPAVLDALAVRLAARATPPTEVTGTTIVSSVNRGPADLTLAGARVLFTAGFPAVSSVHGLTHGVHGIGDRVTISIAGRGHAAEAIDAYAGAVTATLG